MVEVFKTSVRSNADAAWVLAQLEAAFPEHEINFDLEDCDHILRLETNALRVDITSVLELVKNQGFDIEVLPDEIPNKRRLIA